MARIHQLFRLLKEQSGSDLHLAAGLRPRLRTHGELVDIEGWSRLSHEDLLGILREITSEEQWRDFASPGGH